MASTHKEAVYDAEIFPLLKQVLEICKREGINMATMFSLGAPEGGDGLLTCNSVLMIDKADREGWNRASDIRQVATGRYDLMEIQRLVREGR